MATVRTGPRAQSGKSVRSAGLRRGPLAASVATTGTVSPVDARRPATRPWNWRPGRDGARPPQRDAPARRGLWRSVLQGGDFFGRDPGDGPMERLTTLPSALTLAGKAPEAFRRAGDRPRHTAEPPVTGRPERRTRTGESVRFTGIRRGSHGGAARTDRRVATSPEAASGESGRFTRARRGDLTASSVPMATTRAGPRARGGNPCDSQDPGRGLPPPRARRQGRRPSSPPALRRRPPAPTLLTCDGRLARAPGPSPRPPEEAER